MRTSCVLLVFATLVGVCPAAPPTSPEVAYDQQVVPFLKKYCIDCHGPTKQKADVRLDQFTTLAAVVKDRKIWDAILRNIDSGDMPPSGRPKPMRTEVDGVITLVQRHLSTLECQKRDPGRVTLRRLNRNEYNNTIRDLLAIEFKPADDFPSDDVGYGFDNIGDVLALPPILLEKYLAAAEKIVDKAIGKQANPDASVRPFALQQMRWSSGSKNFYGDRKWPYLVSNNEVADNYLVTRPADYAIKLRAFGEQAGNEPVKIVIKVDDREVKTFDVPATESKPGNYEVTLKLKEGPHKIAVAFVNDFYDDKAKKDRNAIIAGLSITGPLNIGPPTIPASHKLVMIAEPKENATLVEQEIVARKILENFARRAYRRPVKSTEVERLVKLYAAARKQGDDHEQGVKFALQAVLVSPHFLFRVELDKEPNNPNAVHPVNDFEFASRLSYFLWATMPDDELFALAAKGTLRQPAVLDAQVRRMLKDARAQTLVENFAGQWLQLRNLASLTPDKEQFRTYNPQLRAAMIRETELFFESILREDKSILTFLDADYTFLNGLLAKHYGIKNVSGEQFVKVTLTPAQQEQRGGLLTQASILTVTSNPTRTSPVKRGKWILDNILGTPPPPAPPDVPELNEDKNAALKGNLRQRMEQHRANPACASCHQRMDPLGFAFENFDTIGTWRTTDGPHKIDPAGTLPSGQSFKGPQELKKILKARAPDFARCLTEKLLTYGIGRGLETYDRCAIDELVKKSANSDYRFQQLIVEIVKSDPFQNRRGNQRGPQQ
jgi:hypothetical protein